MMDQFCARWGCVNSATYDKPLCYDDNDFVSQVCYYEGGDGVLEQYPLMCDDCLDVTLAEDGKEKARKRYLPGSPKVRDPKRKPIIAHADIKRPIRYVYILKLSDGGFYVDQTNELGIRLQEHKMGDRHRRKVKTLSWYIMNRLKVGEKKLTIGKRN